jgi:hypothetical protein
MKKIRTFIHSKLIETYQKCAQLEQRNQEEEASRESDLYEEQIYELRERSEEIESLLNKLESNRIINITSKTFFFVLGGILLPLLLGRYINENSLAVLIILIWVLGFIWVTVAGDHVNYDDGSDIERIIKKRRKKHFLNFIKFIAVILGYLVVTSIFL